MSDEAIDQRQLLLATLPPSRRQIRAALVVVVVLVVLFVVTVPFVRTPLPRVEAVIPILATTTLINDLITSVLLFSQFCIARRRALLVLASGYLFTSSIVIPWALTFPGLFAPTGLLGAGLQTTAWLYAYWHIGSPLILIVATLIRDLDNKPKESQHSPAAAIGLSVAVVIVTVCGLTWSTIAGDQFLPRIVLPDGAHLNLSIATLISASFMVLAGIALTMLWTRRRSVLELWLMVVCCAWLLETATAAVLIDARFNLGWYTGRIFGIIATFVVLLVLLSETLALYANLARSIIRQRNDRNARQIAMDAMAASIVHEISQPLSAMVSNASASLHWLKKEKPDLNEVGACIEDIIADGHRASDVIGSIRSMFKKGAHGRVLIDINDLAREALAITDLDLRTHRVSVAADLRSDLPQLVADRGQLQQVFLNLITNAIEAMKPITERARQLRISSNMIEDSSDIVISVEDTGVGVEDGEKRRIFEPFYTTKSTGTGIGLAICKSIVESHGGSLQASVNKPFGAIFQVTLPTGDI